MNYRTDSFIQKFTSALHYLNQNSIQNIVSIKYRDNCPNSSEYDHFINDYIKNEMHLDVCQLNGDFQGKAWLVSDPYQNKIILVEHETGLEILYIAGSVASLISLIPIINSGWKFCRNKFFRHPYHPDDMGKIEIRKLDQKNTIVEQHIQNIDGLIINAYLQENGNLNTRLDKLENEITDLKKLINKQVKLPKTKKKRKKG